MAKSRLRPDWVIDWLKDPANIMPGTKMPAPYLPDAEILNFFASCSFSFSSISERSV